MIARFSSLAAWTQAIAALTLNVLVVPVQSQATCTEPLQIQTNEDCVTFCLGTEVSYHQSTGVCTCLGTSAGGVWVSYTGECTCPGGKVTCAPPQADGDDPGESNDSPTSDAPKQHGRPYYWMSLLGAAGFFAFASISLQSL